MSDGETSLQIYYSATYPNSFQTEINENYDTARSHLSNLVEKTTHLLNEISQAYPECFPHLESSELSTAYVDDFLPPWLSEVFKVFRFFGLMVSTYRVFWPGLYVLLMFLFHAFDRYKIVSYILPSPRGITYCRIYFVYYRFKCEPQCPEGKQFEEPSLPRKMLESYFTGKEIPYMGIHNQITTLQWHGDPELSPALTYSVSVDRYIPQDQRPLTEKTYLNIRQGSANGRKIHFLEFESLPEDLSYVLDATLYSTDSGSAIDITVIPLHMAENGCSFKTLAAKTQLLKYKKPNDENDEVCAVCMIKLEQDDEIRKLPCDHVYHALCVTIWLVSHGTCPLCFQPVREDE